MATPSACRPRHISFLRTASAGMSRHRVPRSSHREDRCSPPPGTAGRACFARPPRTASIPLPRAESGPVALVAPDRRRALMPLGPYGFTWLASGIDSRSACSTNWASRSAATRMLNLRVRRKNQINLAIASFTANPVADVAVVLPPADIEPRRRSDTRCIRTGGPFLDLDSESGPARTCRIDPIKSIWRRPDAEPSSMVTPTRAQAIGAVIDRYQPQHGDPKRSATSCLISMEVSVAKGGQQYGLGLAELQRTF